jgi:pimeloyl-ACP methyl ester carboxylesterase
MPTMQTSFGTVSYTDDGVGPPVLLLHAALHDRSDFEPVHSAFTRGRRVFALDWPGHGASPMPAEPLRAVQFGDLVVEFADRLDLRNVVVIGNSVGGYAACRLELDRPDRVAGIVLVNTGGFTPHNPATRVLCRRVLGRPAVVKALFPVFVRAYMKATTPHDRAIVRRVVARARTTDGANVAATLWRSFTDPGHDLRTRAADITAPVLITWGAADPTAPLRWGTLVADSIFGAALETFPTGHVVFSSAPTEWLTRVIPFVDAAHGVRPDASRAGGPASSEGRHGK